MSLSFFSISFITAYFWKVLISSLRKSILEEAHFNVIPKAFTEFFSETIVSSRFVSFHFIQFMFYFLFCDIIPARSKFVAIEFRKVFYLYILRYILSRVVCCYFWKIDFHKKNINFCYWFQFVLLQLDR